MDLLGIEEAVCNQNRRLFMLPENLLSVIDSHVMESIRITPSYGSLSALLVIAEFETMQTSVLRKPDYEIKFAG